MKLTDKDCHFAKNIIKVLRLDFAIRQLADSRLKIL